MHHAEDYLAKAKAAGKAAAGPLSPVTKKCWETVAETHLEMAAHEMKPDRTQSPEETT